MGRPGAGGKTQCRRSVLQVIRPSRCCPLVVVIKHGRSARLRDLGRFLMDVGGRLWCTQSKELSPTASKKETMQ
jgi:hypothetical protein